jgi:hypothetical protein
VLTKVVGRGDPFHSTIESVEKFWPNTVKVKADPPAVTVFGERLEIWGHHTLCGEGAGKGFAAAGLPAIADRQNTQSTTRGREIAFIENLLLAGKAAGRWLARRKKSADEGGPARVYQEYCRDSQ